MSDELVDARFVVACEAHEIPERPPLRVAAGDTVTAERRESDWPAFVFVTAGRGSGWVPARHLSASEGPATVIADYDTTELAVEAGAVIEVIERDEESGWYWCRAADGREGWVPVRLLRPASPRQAGMEE